MKQYPSVVLAIAAFAILAIIGGLAFAGSVMTVNGDANINPSASTASVFLGGQPVITSFSGSPYNSYALGGSYEARSIFDSWGQLSFDHPDPLHPGELDGAFTFWTGNYADNQSRIESTNSNLLLVQDGITNSIALVTSYDNGSVQYNTPLFANHPSLNTVETSTSLPSIIAIGHSLNDKLTYGYQLDVKGNQLIDGYLALKPMATPSVNNAVATIYG